VGDILDVSVRNELDGFPATFITDVNADVVNPLAGPECFHPLPKRHDGLSLVSRCKVVCVKRYNYLAMLSAVL
jgi:hypothetical protein